MTVTTRSITRAKTPFCFALLCAIATQSIAESPQSQGNETFRPVPVRFIYSNERQKETADESLIMGRVINGSYKMTSPASKKWRIAFLFPHMKDPYWVGCSYGVISEAMRLGIAVEIFPAKGYDDLDGQLSKMNDVIAEKYDAIVVSPISLTENNELIAKSRALGIPVFELANDSTSDDLAVKVTTSLKSMGTNAVNWTIHDAKKNGLKTVNIGLLPGPSGAGWVVGEVTGALEAARKSKIKVNIVDIKYGDSDRIIQSNLATQLLSEHGEKLNYIIGCTGCAPAAILPLKEFGLNKKIKLISFDLTGEIADYIFKGDIIASADTKGVSQAQVVTNVAVEFLEGRLKKKPHTILIKLGLVDRSNYATYKFDASIAPDRYTPVLTYTP